MSERREVSGNLPAEIAERQSDRSAFPPSREELEARLERTERVARRAAQYLNLQSAAHEELLDLAPELLNLLLKLRADRESVEALGRAAQTWLESTARRLAERDEP